MNVTNQFIFQDRDQLLDALQFKNSGLQAHLVAGEPVDVGRWRFRLVGESDQQSVMVEVLPPRSWWCRLWLKMFPGACHRARDDIESHVCLDQKQFRPVDFRLPVKFDDFGRKVHQWNMPSADLRGAERWTQICKRGVGGNFAQADLANAQLHDTNVWRACFRGARLDQCNFEGSTVASVDFSNASLKDANLQKLRMLSCCDFTDVDLSSTRITLADDYIPGDLEFPLGDTRLVHLVSGLLRTLQTIGDTAVKEALAMQLLAQLESRVEVISRNTSVVRQAIVLEHLREFAIFMPSIKQRTVDLTKALLQGRLVDFRSTSAIFDMSNRLALPAGSLPPSPRLNVSVWHPSKSAPRPGRQWLTWLSGMLTSLTRTTAPAAGS